MAQMTGADIADLERGAARLESVGSRVGGMRRPLRSQLHSSHWHGAAADRFRSEWDSVHGPSLSNAGQFLIGAGHQLRAEADQQWQASTAGIGRGASRLEPCVVTPEGARASLVDRYAASRTLIAERLTALDEALGWVDEQLDRLPVTMFGFMLSPIALGLWKTGAGVRGERRNLAQLDNIENRQMLTVSGEVGDERITEVYGDLNSADRVIVHVPGMSTDLADYANGHQDALSLKAAAEASSGLKVAVVSFADYDIPQDVAAAAMTHGATDGAPKLRALIDELHGMGYRTDQLSVVGHSYGSVVIGHAMQDGLSVRKVVVAGSPGMGANDRAGLGSPSVDLVAIDPGSLDVVTDDLAGWGNAHGLSPNNGNFGIRTLPVSGNLWHSSYFKGETGRVLAGEAVN